jgi:hypothetical protein
VQGRCVLSLLRSPHIRLAGNMRRFSETVFRKQVTILLAFFLQAKVEALVQVELQRVPAGSS